MALLTNPLPKITELGSNPLIDTISRELSSSAFTYATRVGVRQRQCAVENVLEASLSDRCQDSTSMPQLRSRSSNRAECVMKVLAATGVVNPSRSGG